MMAKDSELERENLHLLRALNLSIKNDFKTLKEHNEYYSNIIGKLGNLYYITKNLERFNTFFYANLTKNKQTFELSEFNSLTKYLLMPIEEVLELFQFLIFLKKYPAEFNFYENYLKQVNEFPFEALTRTQELQIEYKKENKFKPNLDEIKTQAKDCKLIQELIAQDTNELKNYTLKGIIDSTKTEIKSWSDKFYNLQNLFIEKGRSSVHKTIAVELVNFVKENKFLTEAQIENKLNEMLQINGWVKSLKPLVKKLHETIHGNQQQAAGGILSKIFRYSHQAIESNITPEAFEDILNQDEQAKFWARNEGLPGLKDRDVILR